MTCICVSPELLLMQGIWLYCGWWGYQGYTRVLEESTPQKILGRRAHEPQRRIWHTQHKGWELLRYLVPGDNSCPFGGALGIGGGGGGGFFLDFGFFMILCSLDQYHLPAYAICSAHRLISRASLKLLTTTALTQHCGWIAG